MRARARAGAGYKSKEEAVGKGAKARGNGGRGAPGQGGEPGSDEMERGIAISTKAGESGIQMHVKRSALRTNSGECGRSAIRIKSETAEGEEMKGDSKMSARTKTEAEEIPDEFVCPISMDVCPKHFANITLSPEHLNQVCKS